MKILSVVFVLAACASNGSRLASALDSERCGLVSVSSNQFKFQDGNSGKARNLSPQDGATTNILTEYAKNKKTACITADWSPAGDVFVTSAARVREGKEAMSEECGTIMETEMGLFIETSGGNSEDNTQIQLKPTTPALKKMIRDLAANLEEVCVKGDFKKDPVEISSPEQIRNWFR